MHTQTDAMSQKRGWGNTKNNNDDKDTDDDNDNNNHENTKNNATTILNIGSTKHDNKKRHMHTQQTQ